MSQTAVKSINTNQWLGSLENRPFHWKFDKRTALYLSNVRSHFENFIMVWSPSALSSLKIVNPYHLRNESLKILLLKLVLLTTKTISSHFSAPSTSSKLSGSRQLQFHLYDLSSVISDVVASIPQYLTAENTRTIEIGKLSFHRSNLA